MFAAGEVATARAGTANLASGEQGHRVGGVWYESGAVVASEDVRRERTRERSDGVPPGNAVVIGDAEPESTMTRTVNTGRIVREERDVGGKVRFREHTH
jgi:hypothetical protein